MNSISITQDELKQRVHYNPITGKFVWRYAVSNNVVSGSECGTITKVCNKRGSPTVKYRRIVFNDGVGIMAHRLAFLYMTGNIPDDYVDHIDGNGLNNAFNNLRIVSHIDNAKNMKKYKNNKSGFTGVSHNIKHGNWKANIRVNKKLIHLGTFDTKDEAIIARKIANIKYGFHSNHGRI